MTMVSIFLFLVGGGGLSGQTRFLQSAVSHHFYPAENWSLEKDHYRVNEYVNLKVVEESLSKSSDRDS